MLAVSAVTSYCDLFRASEPWRERLTAAAGYRLDEDLHRVLGFGAGRADAADAG